ncbi:hypothetical protein LCGC14_2722980 [marine sediment metagenome]|uniref:Uncharacterized protein n=1 Tax=marine sediment metagenome TaxID=412755 RepID=A0A0F9C1B6_9ZZZZ
MQSKLDKLKARIKGNEEEVTIPTEFYLLAKELGCVADLLGREYEVEYDSKGRIKRIRQLPMSVPSFVTLMREMEQDYKRQAKRMKPKKGRK